MIEFLEKISNQYPRLSYLVIHSCPEDVFNELTYEKKLDRILLTTQIIDSSKHCGSVNKQYFKNNIKMK